MKKKINRFICKHFGCDVFTEVYALRHNENKYWIKEDTVCQRCGKVDYKYLATGLSRAELLQHEWFICKSTNY